MIRLTTLPLIALVLTALTTPPTRAATTSTPILVLGDSISVGVGASSPERAFPAVLAELTGEAVSTAGLSGRNLAGAVGQWQQLRGPWPVVVVQIGTNDATHYLTGWIGDLGDWQLIYRELIVEMRAAGVGRVVVVVPGPIESSAEREDRIAAYAAAARGLADVAIVADPWPALSQPGMLVDGIHPGDAGHASIARAISDVLVYRVALPVLIVP